MANLFIPTNTGSGSYVALEVATLAAEAVLRLLRSVAPGSTKEGQTALRLLMAAGAVPASEASNCLALLDRSAALCWRVVHPRR